MSGTTVMAKYKLSVCIATYNRARFIGETLDSIIPQLVGDVELIIVDGASPDDTQQVVQQHIGAHPRVRYIREPTNSGVDQDYDKAVGYASGEYCWLMSDDDLLAPGAIDGVLQQLDGRSDLIVVNSKVKNAHLSDELRPRLLDIANDQRHDAPGGEALFAQVATYLSFIGGVVVRRGFWMVRERAAFYGTLFIHIGVLFQHPPVEKAVVLAEPLIVIRYGNAMWTSRSFEIWMFKWPELIWSLRQFSAEARSRVIAPCPFKSLKRLFFFRAIGSYSRAEYRKFLRQRLATSSSRIGPALIALMPARLANFVCGAYYLLRPRKAAGMELYDLARAGHSALLTRAVASAKRPL
jgi:glycosyltransferase involved in cell wall biosynthesis